MAVSQHVRTVTAARDGRRCVRCGRSLYGIPASLHHRRLRSHRFAGTDQPANLIWLCGSGTSGCHGWCHAHPREAMEGGWIVSAYATPSEIPVRMWDGESVLLDDDGGMSRDVV